MPVLTCARCEGFGLVRDESTGTHEPCAVCWGFGAVSMQRIAIEAGVSRDTVARIARGKGTTSHTACAVLNALARSFL